MESGKEGGSDLEKEGGERSTPRTLLGRGFENVPGTDGPSYVSV